MPRLAERLAGPLSQTNRSRRTIRAAVQSTMPRRFGMLSSVFERKTEAKDPALAFRRAETDKSKSRAEQIQQTNISALTDISMLVEDSNQLLTQIIEEVKKLQLDRPNQPPPDLMPDIDFDLDRQGRRGQGRRGRFGARARERLKRMRAAQRARVAAERAPKRTATRVEPPAPRRPQASASAVPEARPPATPPRPTPAPAAGRTLSRSAIRQSIGSRIRQTIADRVTTKIPALGLLFTLFFAGQRVAAGDLVGAGLEIASGAAAAAGPLTFGFGTAVSIGLDIGSLARDVYGDVYGVNIEDDPQREERLGTLTAAIREEVEEMISSSPRPQAPPFNSETRNQLILLYRQAQQDENLRAIIGEDVMAGLVPLMQIDPTKPSPMNERVREGMQRTIDQLQQRITRAPRPAAVPSDLETRASSEDATAAEQPDVRTVENLLQLIRTSEFNDIKLEADKIRFDGEIKQDASQLDASMVTPTSNPIGASPASAATQMGQQTAPVASMVTPTSNPIGASPASAGTGIGQQAAPVAATGAAASEAAPQAAALVGEGTEMVAADQQQIRTAGQQVIVPVATPPTTQQAQQPVRLSHVGRGEVPLNIRLEKQVA